MKVSVVCLMCCVAAASSQAFWVDSSSFIREGMRELEEASKRMEDMLAAESKAKPDRSREELEDKDEDDIISDIDETSSSETGFSPKGGRRPSKEDEDDDDFFNPMIRSLPEIFNIFRKAEGVKNWYSGPNVCVTKEDKNDTKGREGTDSEGSVVISGLDSTYFSSCVNTPRKYKCTTITKDKGETKTSIVTYECCHGYMRLPGKDECQKFETKPTLEKAAELGANKFVSLVESSGLKEKVEAENRTLFVPTDEFLEKYQAKMAGVNQIDTQGNPKAIETNDVMDMVQPQASGDDSSAKNSASTQDLVLNHVVPSIEDSPDFTNNLVLKSESQGSLRVNYFPGRWSPVLTVNCIRINSTDHVTDTGVIHTINGVLTPVVRSVHEILEQPRYSKFKAMLEEHDLWKEISGAGPYTVLAVSDEAFDTLKLETKPCIKKVLKHHIIPHMVCSEAASLGRISALDMSSSWISLRYKNEDESRDEEEATAPTTSIVRTEAESDVDPAERRLLFDSDGVEAVKTDIMATNGLVHEVSGFVVPNSAKSVVQLLRATNATRMLAYLEKAGLTETAEMSDRLTLFVPTEEALSELDSMSPEDLKETLLYHMAGDPGRGPKSDKDSDENEDDDEDEDCDRPPSARNGVIEMTTKNGKKIAVRPPKNLLSSFVGLPGKATVQCVPLVRFNGKMCNGVVHEIASVMQPPKWSLLEIIETDERLGHFRKALKGTKLETELKSMTSPVTILAPSDEAFERVGKSNMEMLMTDKDVAERVLRSHVLAESICCSSIGSISWPFTQTVRSLSGNQLDFNRRPQSSTRGPGPAAVFGPTRTQQCDIVATDGIMHVVDRVMLPMGLRKIDTDVIIRRPYSEIMLTGF